MQKEGQRRTEGRRVTTPTTTPGGGKSKRTIVHENQRALRARPPMRPLAPPVSPTPPAAPVTPACGGGHVEQQQQGHRGGRRRDRPLGTSIPSREEGRTRGTERGWEVRVGSDLHLRSGLSSVCPVVGESVECKSGRCYGNETRGNERIDRVVYRAAVRRLGLTAKEGEREGEGGRRRGREKEGEGEGGREREGHAPGGNAGRKHQFTRTLGLCSTLGSRRSGCLRSATSPSPPPPPSPPPSLPPCPSPNPEL